MKLIKAIIFGIGDILLKHRKYICKQISMSILKENKIKFKVTKGSNFISIRLKEKKLIVNPLFRRKCHVKNEQLNIVSLNHKSRIGILVIQKHNASHMHYDISIIDENKEEIFRGSVTKKEMSDLFPTTGKATNFIQQPKHESSYTLDTPNKFIIPEGEYGAGEVERVFKEFIDIHKTEPEKISFSIYSKIPGRYSLIKRKNSWLCIRKNDPIADINGKAQLRLIGKQDNKKITDEIKKDINKYIIDKKSGKQFEYVSEEKIDGGNNYLKFSNSGNIIWSHRLSKTNNKPIFHHNKYSHLRDEIHPEFENTVVRGELVFSDGNIKRIDNKFYQSNGGQYANIISGLSNTKNPFESREAQKIEKGNISFVIWDIHKYKGKNVEKLSYGEKLQFMDEIASKSKNIFVSRRFSSPEEAWNKIVNEEGGEGIVIKRLDLPSPQPDGGIKNTWLKLKSHDSKDCKIIGWAPLKKVSGIIDNERLGKFVVEDKEGRKFEVGSGIPDFERRWFRKNIDNIIKGESIIKVRYDSESETALQKPVYEGVHYEKSDGIITELSLEKTAKNYGVNKYVLKAKNLFK